MPDFGKIGDGEVSPPQRFEKGIDMRSRRLLGCVVGLLLAVTGCGAVTTGTARAPSATPSADSTPQGVPAGCGSGQARDLDSTLRIIKDGPDCAGSTNRFWQQQLGSRWTPAKFISYDDGHLPDSKCAEGGAPADFADNAFYCPLDDVVAFSNQLMDRLFANGGPYLPVVVLQHELGHRANHLGHTVGVVSRSEENQADCEAGATTHFAENAKRLPLADVFRSAGLLFKLGDVSNFGDETANDPGAHGTPPQRLFAFTRGYVQGIGICDDLGRNPTGHTT
jgi:predicted metalloprotease